MPDAPGSAGRQISLTVLALLVLAAALTYTTFVLQALDAGEIGRLRAAVALLAGNLSAAAVFAAGWVAIGLFATFAATLWAEPMRFERHWGGLGNGTGGWSMSRPFALLVGGTIALGLTIALVTQSSALGDFVTKTESTPAKVAPGAVDTKSNRASGTAGAPSKALAADAGRE
jgi:hypothetical protein